MTFPVDKQVLGF